MIDVSVGSTAVICISPLGKGSQFEKRMLYIRIAQTSLIHVSGTMASGVLGMSPMVGDLLQLTVC